ncbi:MAG: HEPN domain-containing protein [Armatimonadetes bacterium]|nr:HEPN domain-containing protein [Armatimonadota bacterium]
MSAVVDEWVEKAEGDFRTANREFSAAADPNYDAVCFHAQQCIEKLMKAALIVRNVVPPKTHSLILLDSLLSSEKADWSWPLPDLRLLDRAAVLFRYPGESADREEAELAIGVATKMRNKLIQLIRS